MTLDVSGYSGTPLVRKLGIKSGQAACVIDPPDDYFDLLTDLPSDIEWVELGAGWIDFIHLFAEGRLHLESLLPSAKAALAKTGMLWISWPKKSSGVESDLDANIVRHVGLSHGLVDVKVCSVDPTWSGLKFVFRLEDR